LGKDAGKAIPGWSKKVCCEQEIGMEFWIAILGAVAVLFAQWALISLVALGALRRRAQIALRDIDAPMRHYLEEGADAAERARGFGVDTHVLRREKDARERLERELGVLAGSPMEAVDLDALRLSWGDCIRANQAVNHTVLGLPCVVEGWAGIKGDLEIRSERVTNAIEDYNLSVSEYGTRWSKGATSVAGRWFGYRPLEKWPTEEASLLQGW